MAALIAAHRDEHQIPQATACRALGVSRSWFYKHKDRGLTARAARREALTAEIRWLFRAHRGTYGSPRITADLREVRPGAVGPRPGRHGVGQMVLPGAGRGAPERA